MIEIDDPMRRAGFELELGVFALARHDWLEAAQRFEAVLEIDPLNRRAMRELAAIRRRAESRRIAMLERLAGGCR